MVALRSKALIAIILVSLVVVAALEGAGEDGEREGVRLRADKGSSGEGKKLNAREGSAKNLKLRSNSADGVKLRGGEGKDGGGEEEVESAAAKTEGGSRGGEEAGTREKSETSEGVVGGRLMARATSLLPPLGMASPYLRACIEFLRDAKFPSLRLPSTISSTLSSLPMAPALLPLLLLATSTFISR